MRSAFYGKIMHLLFSVSLSLSCSSSSSSENMFSFLSLHFVEGKRANVDPRKNNLWTFKIYVSQRANVVHDGKTKAREQKNEGEIDKMELPLCGHSLSEHIQQLRTSLFCVS